MDTEPEAAGNRLAAPAGTIPSPRLLTPHGKPWTTECLQALLLRVVRAADVGLLLPEDADWIRAQIQTTSHPAPPPNPADSERPQHMMTAYQTPSSGIQQPVIRDQWLTVRMEDWPGAVVVHVAGEIDLCTAPTLSTCLTNTQLENSNRRPVLVINLADVSFLSCAGLRVLLDTQHVAAAHETVLRLVDCPPPVHRLLEVLNLRHQFQLYPSLTDALPWLAPETTSPSSRNIRIATSPASGQTRSSRPDKSS